MSDFWKIRNSYFLSCRQNWPKWLKNELFLIFIICFLLGQQKVKVLLVGNSVFGKMFVLMLQHKMFFDNRVIRFFWSVRWILDGSWLFIRRIINYRFLPAGTYLEMKNFVFNIRSVCLCFSRHIQIWAKSVWSCLHTFWWVQWWWK